MFPRKVQRNLRIITMIAAFALVGVMPTVAAAQPLFMEDFEDGDVTGWIASTPGPSGNGTFEAVTGPVSPSGGDYVGRQTFGGSCIGWYYPVEPAAPDYMSWYFRADGDTGHPSGLGVIPSQSYAGEMLILSYHQGWLRYWESSAPIMPASQGTWYLIELRNIDWAADTVDIWVDGVEMLGGVPFANNLDYVDQFVNYACGASGPSYVDDITVGFYHGFEGFSPPVDNDIVNIAKAGQSIPLKFRVTDANGAPITDLTTPPVVVSSSGTACDGGAAVDAIETYTGGSGLQNLGDGYYQFNWKTPKSYKGQCRTMMVSLGDRNTAHTAEFQFK